MSLAAPKLYFCDDFPKKKRRNDAFLCVTYFNIGGMASQKRNVVKSVPNCDKKKNQCTWLGLYYGYIWLNWGRRTDGRHGKIDHTIIDPVNYLTSPFNLCSRLNQTHLIKNIV